MSKYYVKTFLNRRWICMPSESTENQNEFINYDFVSDKKYWLLIRPWRAKDLDDPNISDSYQLKDINKHE